MKKMVSLLLAALMMLCAVSACADTEMIGDTRLSLDLTGMTIFELTDEDVEDDVVLVFGTEDERMLCFVYEYENDGFTLQKLAEELLAEEEGVTASGYTTIHDIECFCMVMADAEGDYLSYSTILDDEIVEFFFFYTADTAELTGTVMNTMQLH